MHVPGGSHPAFAETQMYLASEAGVLNYHCCVGPDYGIRVSDSQYTKLAIQSMQVADVCNMVFVPQQDDPFTGTTCKAASGFWREASE